jgi:hypothetical protein
MTALPRPCRTPWRSHATLIPSHVARRRVRTAPPQPPFPRPLASTRDAPTSGLSTMPAASARVKPNTRVLNLDSQVVDIHMCTCYAIFDRPNRHHWLDPRSEFTAVVSCFRAGGDSFVVPRLFTQACKCSHTCIGSATLLAPHAMLPHPCFTTSCFRAGGDSFVVPRLFTQACKCSHTCIGSATLLAPHTMLPHPCSFTSAFSRSFTLIWHSTTARCYARPSSSASPSRFSAHCGGTSVHSLPLISSLFSSLS